MEKERKERRVLEIEWFIHLFDAAHRFAHQADMQWYDIIILYFLHKNYNLEQVSFLNSNRIKKVVESLKASKLVYEKIRGSILLAEEGLVLLDQFSKFMNKEVLKFQNENL